MGDYSTCESCGALFVPSQYTRHHKVQAEKIESLRAEVKELRSALRPFVAYAARNGAITLLGNNGGRITSEAWDNAEKALAALSGGEAKP